MNQRNHTTITRAPGYETRLWLSLALLAFAAQLLAHGGFEHVIGTVVKVENNVLTVKTAKAILLPLCKFICELLDGTRRILIPAFGRVLFGIASR